ncbi:MAG: helix-turn-helix domain-containing protein [Pseudomonadota bacterium]|jgi:hypothetical protein|nr:helix-turn-helix domain-containing protein [Pseudomonadota bacterium]
MIGRKSKKTTQEDVQKPLGFDDFEIRLGDVMRGERATLGKSLLDVQREIRIKASYIAAIENCDPTAFDTPGFIAGYVRSYARYLGMDPDETFASFCKESGFSTAHGMSEKASGAAKSGVSDRAIKTSSAADPFAQPKLPFAPSRDSFLSQIEPGAIGSSLVLIALVCGLGYGGYSVLQEVQRVRLAPVEQTPVVLSDLDPVETAFNSTVDQPEQPTEDVAGVFTPPSNEALDRLYRPQALDVPVLVARDAPISTLDPSEGGAFASLDQRNLPSADALTSEFDGIETALAEAMQSATPQTPKVFEDNAPGVTLMAVRPSWVRVRSADGSVIYETIMNAGDTYQVPQTTDPATLRIGESGAVYFVMNGETYGPVGPRGSVTSNLALSVDELQAKYQVAEIQQDADLERVIAELSTSALVGRE